VSAALITIVGPPGVGKTTLARGLSQVLEARLILEDYKGNPFLRDAYVQGGDVNLPCQLYFLMSRARQLARSTWPEEGLVVSDYDFCQDRLYARRRLSQEDYRLYDEVAGRVSPHIRRTDVMIHLDADAAELTSRIRLRGRTFEKAMDAAFLERMRRAYYQDELEQAARRIIRIDTQRRDPRDAQVLRRLADEIRQELDAD
jgi:deoxyadenosine/deoxycytidine kinase